MTANCHVFKSAGTVESQARGKEKLSEVRRQHETSKQPPTDARAMVERWFDENKAEAKRMIDQWVKNGDTQQLAARAQKAEECAWTAIRIAQASIDDAERMILERSPPSSMLRWLHRTN